MKRVLLGVVWFAAFFVTLYVIFSVIVAFLALHGSGVQPGDREAALQAAVAYSRAHAQALAVWRLVILLAAILLAVWGTLKGWLPGTRKKTAAAS